MESLKKIYRNKEQISGTKGWGWEVWDKRMKVVKVYKLLLLKSVSSRAITYSMVTTVNNTIVYLKVTKRVNLKSSHHAQKYVR